MTEQRTDLSAIPSQQQEWPGTVADLTPQPDHGETSWTGRDRLTGRRALITGADSGIGRAVAIAFAKEGASVAIVDLPEVQEDMAATKNPIEVAAAFVFLASDEASFVSGTVLGVTGGKPIF